MLEINVLLVMILCAFASAWGTHFYLSQNAYKEAREKLLAFRLEFVKNMQDLNSLNRENAIEFSKLSKKVEEMSNRVELQAMMAPKKPFGETRKV